MLTSLLHTLPHAPTRRQYPQLGAGAEHGAVVVFAEEGVGVHEALPLQRKAMAEAVVLHAAAVGTEFLPAYGSGNAMVVLQALHRCEHAISTGIGSLCQRLMYETWAHNPSGSFFWLRPIGHFRR